MSSNVNTEGSKNLEKELSELRAKFSKAEYDRDENWKLVMHGCNILADLKDKVHAFKEQTESDCLAWHKSYRNQLAIEREENMNLRNQIFDMQAAAGRANGHLRDLRRYLVRIL
jgi:Zn-dependent oligopeptidase